MTETLKIHLINPTDEWHLSLDGFFKVIGKPVEKVSSPDDAVVTITWVNEPMEATDEVLSANGRISCPLAFAVASRMGLSRSDFGDLANLLKIKIYGCQLGCFK